MNIPFLDLKTQYEGIRDEIGAALQAVLDRTAFAGGPFVETFEGEFAAYCETPHAIGVGSGTEALWLALLALNVGPGDEVITVANTFIATAEAISFCGATPVFVDIDEATYGMDASRIEAAITARTRAIVPVHLYGHVADMDPILAIARRHGLAVVEDACQAHGARYKGRRAGSMGDAGCFSFYPGKNLGAYGEAGAVITGNAGLADAMRVLRDHGQPRKYHHDKIGWNARMDGFQAAVLSVKLRHLEAWTAARRAHAVRYDERLRDVAGLTRPVEGAGVEAVYHLYVVRVADRDGLSQALGRDGIGSGIHYPVPLHLQKAYALLGHGAGDFPVSERCAREILSLPMFPELTVAQIDHVAEQVRAALGEAAIV